MSVLGLVSRHGYPAITHLQFEVVHVPAPEGYDFEKDGMMASDGDISLYCRPEPGDRILIGSEDPECDPRE